MGQKNSRENCLSTTATKKIRRHSVCDRAESDFETLQAPRGNSDRLITEPSKGQEPLEDFYPPHDRNRTPVKDKGNLYSELRGLPPQTPRGNLSRTSSNEMALEIDYPRTSGRSQAPSILYYLDNHQYRLSVLDPKTEIWKKNDLKQASCEHPNFGLSSYATVVFRNQILSQLQESVLVAVDNDTIHVIGKMHLEYSISKNNFTLLREQAPKFTNPTVCFGANNIFLLSGQHGTECVNNCVRYDLAKKVWITMPSLPSPHVNGSATVCYFDAEKRDSYKIVIVGGFSSRIPTLFNYTASVFDSESNSWDVIPLEVGWGKPIRFIRAPIVQNSERNLLILHHDGEELDFYLLDINSRNLSEAEGHHTEMGVSIQKKAPFCVTEDNNLMFLARGCKYTKSLPDLAEDPSERADKGGLSPEYSVIKINLSPNQSLLSL